MMITIRPDYVILSMFNADGVWTGPAERTIMFLGEFVNIDTYAEENGIIWPDGE